MFETYRMLGREREAELESEAARLRPLSGRPTNKIWVALTAVVVAALAFGASAGRAEFRLGVRPEPASQLGPPDLVERWVASHKTQQLAPPDLVERWVASHRRQVVQTSTPAGNSRADGGFNRRLALAGASTFAALLLAAGIVIAVVRRTRIRSAAA